MPYRKDTRTEWEETAEEYRLWCWMQEQRKEYHAGTLSLYKIKKLEAIPGWTWELDKED